MLWLLPVSLLLLPAAGVQDAEGWMKERHVPPDLQQKVRRYYAGGCLTHMVLIAL